MSEEGSNGTVAETKPEVNDATEPSPAKKVKLDTDSEAETKRQPEDAAETSPAKKRKLEDEKEDGDKTAAAESKEPAAAASNEPASELEKKIIRQVEVRTGQYCPDMVIQ